MNRKKLTSISIFWSLFISLGALWGALMMFIDPSGQMWGLEEILPALQVLPWPEVFFTNFIFSGIVLFCVNGLTNAVSFILLIRRQRYAPQSVICCGVILMLWITLQFIIFPLNVLSTAYFVFGLLQTLTGYFLLTSKK